MKYTREFWFIPTWPSRGYSWCTPKDLYSVPPFNWVAKYLNDKEWEIDSFKYYEDSNPYTKVDGMKKLQLFCSKTTDFFAEEESYSYSMCKEGMCYITPDYKRVTIEIGGIDLWRRA